MKNLKLKTTQNNDNHPHLQELFTFPELTNALKLIKTGKLLDPMACITNSYYTLELRYKNGLLTTPFQHTIPKMWRRAKVTAILKPGKEPKVLHSYCITQFPFSVHLTSLLNG